MNAADALLWTIERDPCLRSTIVAIAFLDRSPNWDRLSTQIADACDYIPRLHQRVVAAPFGLGPPRWETDDYFDLTYHLKRTLAPEPCDHRTVLDIAGHMAMSAFDKDRPLWEFVLVEGLNGGQAALIQKVHHSVTDGVGGMKLARLLLDEKRNPPVAKRHAKVVDHQRVGALTSIAGWFAGDLKMVASASLRGAQALPGAAAKMATRPGEPIFTIARHLRSIGKLLAPVTTPLSPIMTHRGMSRRLDTIDVPIEQLLASAHAADSSLNDAFLAGIAGGMRSYHERHGAPVSELRVTMPINTRRSSDPAGSNRFTPARFKLPIATLDVSDRMRQLGELARGWRAEPALPLTDVIAGVLNTLPAPATTAIFGSMLKAIDFVATNVPGLTHRAYLAGAEVKSQYAFAPPSGSAVSVALMSHLDLCCIGINVDTAAIPDPDVLTACLRAGFDEVLSVGRK
jgi:diacylglycerol O-acyltransferase